VWRRNTGLVYILYNDGNATPFFFESHMSVLRADAVFCVRGLDGT
jgi:hypothetical protein